MHASNFIRMKVESQQLANELQRLGYEHEGLKKREHELQVAVNAQEQWIETEKANEKVRKYLRRLFNFSFAGSIWRF